MGSGSVFPFALGNCEARNETSFCSSVIAISPLLPLTGVVDKALNDVYLRAVQHLWVSRLVVSSSITPCRKSCQHFLLAFRTVIKGS
jgi:hypothetical protein